MTKKINLRYVIGELLIVIFGISIAFALNNWAQRNQEKKLAKKYLTELKTDIENDLAVLEKEHEKLIKKSAMVNSFIPHLFAEIPGRDSIPSLFFRKIHEYTGFLPHRTTYESMMHSGDLKLIRDFDLKNSIVEHYNSYTKLFQVIERHENFTKKYTSEFFMKETNHGLLFSKGQPELLDLPYMKNLFFSSKGILQMQITAFAEAIEDCKMMIEKIDPHLN